jgi:hypothetical protein
MHSITLAKADQLYKELRRLAGKANRRAYKAEVREDTETQVHYKGIHIRLRKALACFNYCKSRSRSSVQLLELLTVMEFGERARSALRKAEHGFDNPPARKRNLSKPTYLERVSPSVCPVCQSPEGFEQARWTAHIFCKSCNTMFPLRDSSWYRYSGEG